MLQYLDYDSVKAVAEARGGQRWEHFADELDEDIHWSERQDWLHTYWIHEGGFRLFVRIEEGAVMYAYDTDPGPGDDDEPIEWVVRGLPENAVMLEVKRGGGVKLYFEGGEQWLLNHVTKGGEAPSNPEVNRLWPTDWWKHWEYQELCQKCQVWVRLIMT